MANTSSWSFPNLIDVTHNKISIATDDTSVVNRTKLLLLSNPTELYNEPKFGVGLKKYLWQYNTANVRAKVEDDIRQQLQLFEPCVDAPATVFSNDSVFSSSSDSYQHPNELNMTVGLRTIYGGTATVDLNLSTES